MHIFSHRGIGFGKPENSLESFRAALDKGFSIEVDVQKTKDDYLVVNHDIELSRLNVHNKITNMNYRELQPLGIPSLDEVLSEFTHYHSQHQLIALHVKDENQGDILARIDSIITAHNLEKDCFLFDLTKNGASYLRQRNPSLRVGISLGEKRYSPTIFLHDDLIDFSDYDIIWLDEWNSGLYNSESLKRIKSLKKTIYAISPELHKVHGHPQSGNQELVYKVWDELLESRIDGICTDFPEELSYRIRLSL